jgi:hypothetical protein
MINTKQARELREHGLSFVSINTEANIISARMKFSKCITPASIACLNSLAKEQGLKNVQTKHIQDVLDEGVLFDFGTIDEDVIYKESMRGRKLYSQGVLDLPFEKCMFKFKSSASQIGERIELFCLINKNSNGMIITGFIKSNINGEQVLMPVATFEITDHKYNTLPDMPGRELIQGYLLHPKNIGEDLEKEYINILYKSVFCPLMILNTRYVPFTKKVVPKTFKGVKRSKTSESSIIFVDGKLYTEFAKAKTNQNKRTPHLRRGHVRTLCSGKQVWVKDCLVNFSANSDINGFSSNDRSYKVIHNQTSEVITNNQLLKKNNPDWMGWLGFSKSNTGS